MRKGFVAGTGRLNRMLNRAGMRERVNAINSETKKQEISKDTENDTESRKTPPERNNSSH